MTTLRDLLNSRVLVADGAMGTMLQAQGDLDLERDFQGLEGCNEVLNVTRPDVVAAVHRAYLEAGSDCIETNTFGTNLAALAEYDIVDRLAELAEAGARIARAAADEFTGARHEAAEPGARHLRQYPRCLPEPGGGDDRGRSQRRAD